MGEEFVMLDEAKEKNGLAGQFVMKLFHARTNAHVLHLRTRSYAQHKALDDFYSDIVDLADRFAETYQGVYGLMNVTGKYTSEEDPVTMLTDLRSWIAERRTEICDEPECQNIIDEIQELISSTLYKLKFLK